MKYILIFFLVPFLFNVFSQEKDSIAIVNLIIDDYTTMETWNLKRHLENTTKSYLLIEKGEVLNLKMESDYYKKKCA